MNLTRHWFSRCRLYKLLPLFLCFCPQFLLLALRRKLVQKFPHTTATQDFGDHRLELYAAITFNPSFVFFLSHFEGRCSVRDFAASVRYLEKMPKGNELRSKSLFKT